MWPFSGARVNKDPVCGMDVETNNSLLQFHGTETYYFCSSSCRSTFQDEPGKYDNSSEAATEESKEEEAVAPAGP